VSDPHRHDAEVQRIADELRRQGYDVTLDGRVGGVEVDVLAVRGSEKRAVEVKVSGTSRAAHKRSEDMARTLRDDGWEFRLVVVEPEPFDVGTVDPSSIEARLERARTLAASDPEAALLLAWSMFEAAARRALVLESATNAAESAPGLAKQLVHHGLLGNEDLRELLSIAQRRNALAHGALASGASANDVDHLATWGRELLKVA
jgi:hypothetical protein